MTPLRVSLYMVLAAFTLAAADDPGGWTAAKWGMTDAQILQAIPAATRLDPPEKYNHARVHIPSFDLAGAKFHIYFVPGPDGLLNSVLLAPEQSTSTLDVGPLFQTLVNLLVTKYGRPWRSTEGPNAEVQWSVKTTIVVLSRIRFPGIDTQILNLQYRKADPDLDKM